MTRSLDDMLERMRPDSIAMGLSLAQVTGRPAVLSDGSIVNPPPMSPARREPRDKNTRDRQRAADARCAGTDRKVWRQGSGVRASITLADGALVSAACRSEHPNDVATALDRAIEDHLEHVDAAEKRLERARQVRAQQRVIRGSGVRRRRR